ncbi:MAG: phosphotransferase, partial [Bacteroidota bacterium]
MMNIQEINSHFRIDGRFASATTIGSGHINDSWLVITNGLNVGATGPVAITEYVLQRINKNIFKNIPELTNNILKVTGHLRLKSLNFSPAFQTYQIIRLIPAISGEYFYLDPGGNYWRLYNHVTGSRSYDVVENPQMAYEAGKAFGLFQHLTADMDATTLFEVLPGFHNIAKRLADFRKTVSLDPVSRVAEVAEEINFVESRAGEMHTILRLGEQGKIPVRVTHNDTKCNNVLFNQENQAIAVVDLDTMM